MMCLGYLRGRKEKRPLRGVGPAMLSPAGLWPNNRNLDRICQSAEVDSVCRG